MLSSCLSSGVLTSDSITESISGCGPNYNGLQVFAISGANVNSPFDPNAALPGTGSDGSSGQQSLTSASISTNNPTDMLFAGVQHGTGAVANPGSGFTSIISTGGYGAEYEITGASLTNFAVTFSFSISSYWQMIADAVVPALTIDGSAIATCSNSTTSCSATLSTSNMNDIVIVYASETLDVQTSCTFSVSDTAGLTWAARGGIVFGRSNGVSYRDQLQEFWAKSSAILTSDSITESISGCGPNYNGLQVFAISGANFNYPFDPNSGLPDSGSDSSSGQQSLTSATVSTNNPNDIVFAGVQHGTGAVANPGSGFTSIISTGGYGTEYQLVDYPIRILAIIESSIRKRSQGRLCNLHDKRKSDPRHTTNRCSVTNRMSAECNVFILSFLRKSLILVYPHSCDDILHSSRVLHDNSDRIRGRNQPNQLCNHRDTVSGRLLGIHR